MDLNINLLKRDVKYYQLINKLHSNIFAVKYSPTGDKFGLRIVELKEHSELDVYENENSLTNRLKHKNLMPFITSFVTLSQLWTVMPFAEFQSLADLSKPFGFSEEAIALVMKDVLEAVNYLHNNCIIHHSIRCSHIILLGSPETEFRCLLSGLKYSVNTIRNGEIKTQIYDYPIRTHDNINWVAPEVLEQNLLGYDNKADIYSIGITCCELSNGSIPFGGLEAEEVLLNKLNGETPEPLDCDSEDIKQFIEYEKELVKDLEEDMKTKYELYLKKKFSQQFKNFTVNSCLHPEPHCRLNASQLLRHSFIKSGENLDKTNVLMDSIRINKYPEQIKKFL